MIAIARKGRDKMIKVMKADKKSNNLLHIQLK
jgi:hypothetical protein